MDGDQEIRCACVREIHIYLVGFYLLVIYIHTDTQT